MIRKIFEYYAAFLTLSWGNGAHRMTGLLNYPQAARYFKEHDRPRGKKWLLEQRPLYNSRSHHYRIEEGQGGEYYDLVLYETPLVRYYKPDGATSVTWLRSTDRTTDAAFLSTAGWAQRRSYQGKGCIPLSPYVAQEYRAQNGVLVPADWSAVIVRHATNDALVKHSSAHRPVYRKRSSEEDVARRKEVRKKHETTVETLLLRFSTLEASTKAAMYDSSLRIQGMGLRKFFETGVANDSTGVGLATLVEKTYVSLLARAALRERERLSKQPPQAGPQYAWTYHNRMLVKPVTVADMRNELKRLIVYCAEGYKNQTNAREEVEQFPEELPSRFVWA